MQPAHVGDNLWPFFDLRIVAHMGFSISDLDLECILGIFIIIDDMADLANDFTGNITFFQKLTQCSGSGCLIWLNASARQTPPFVWPLFVLHHQDAPVFYDQALCSGHAIILSTYLFVVAGNHDLITIFWTE